MAGITSASEILPMSYEITRYPTSCDLIALSETSIASKELETSDLKTKFKNFLFSSPVSTEPLKNEKRGARLTFFSAIWVASSLSEATTNSLPISGDVGHPVIKTGCEGPA